MSTLPSHSIHSRALPSDPINFRSLKIPKNPTETSRDVTKTSFVQKTRS